MSQNIITKLELELQLNSSRVFMLLDQQVEVVGFLYNDFYVVSAAMHGSRSGLDCVIGFEFHAGQHFI